MDNEEYELVDCGRYGLSIQRKLKKGQYDFTGCVSEVEHKTTLEKLNSECFNGQNHIIDNSVIDTNEAFGYCESSRVKYRPKEHCYAVMFLIKRWEIIGFT